MPDGTVRRRRPLGTAVIAGCLALVVAAVGGPAPATSTQATEPEAVVSESVPEDWVLRWSDEFDGPAGTLPNSQIWGYDLGDGSANGLMGWGNNELQWYTDEPANVALDGDGHLVISALRRPAIRSATTDRASTPRRACSRRIASPSSTATSKLASGCRPASGCGRPSGCIIRLALGLSLAAAFAATSQAVIATGEAAPAPAAVAEPVPVAAPRCSSVEDCLAQMTLEEKIGQMTQVNHRALFNDSDIAEFALGSLLSGGGGSPITGNTPEDWADMVDGYQSIALSSRLGIPLIYGVDAVHGHSNVFGATIFPHNIGLGATRNPELVGHIGQITGP